MFIQPLIQLVVLIGCNLMISVFLEIGYFLHARGLEFGHHGFCLLFGEFPGLKPHEYQFLLT